MKISLALLLCVAAITEGRIDDAGSSSSDGLSVETAEVAMSVKRYKDTDDVDAASTGSKDDGIIVKRQTKDEGNSWMDSVEFEAGGHGRSMCFSLASRTFYIDS